MDSSNHVVTDVGMPSGRTLQRRPLAVIAEVCLKGRKGVEFLLIEGEKTVAPGVCLSDMCERSSSAG